MKKLRSSWLYFILPVMLLVFIVAISRNGAAQETAEQKQQQQTLELTLPPIFPNLLDWTTTEWTGDDAPYLKIEHDMDQEVKEGKSIKQIIEEKRTAALQSPKTIKDKQKAFAWAYALELDSLADNTSFLGNDAVVQALVADDPKNVYEYTRLHFLLIQYDFPNTDLGNLKLIGERLLKHRPDDLLVKVCHVYNLCNPRTISQAQAFAEDWVKKEPHKDSPHLLLAFVYQDLMIFNSSRVYADKSIAEYQAYLKYAAPNAPSRKNSEYLVGALEKIKASLPSHPIMQPAQ